MIQGEHSIALPVLGDDALISESEMPSYLTESLSDLSIFRYTCELFSVVGDILTTLYCNNGALLPASTDTRGQSETLSQIMALNGRLEAYLITLPDYIRDFIQGREQTVSQDAPHPMLLYQQAISCRYSISRCDMLVDNEMLTKMLDIFTRGYSFCVQYCFYRWITLTISERETCHPRKHWLCMPSISASRPAFIS